MEHMTVSMLGFSQIRHPMDSNVFHKFAVSFLVLVLGVGSSSLSPAVGQGTPEDYEAWRTYKDRMRGRVFRDHVNPHWVDGKSRYFWYRIDANEVTTHYVLVDCEKGQRDEFQSYGELLDSLSERTGEASIESMAVVPAQSKVAVSRVGGKPALICFENNTDNDLTYHWVQPDGSRKQYGVIETGKSRQVQTYDGHAWIVQDTDGETVAAFVASGAKEMAVIDQSTPKPRDLKSHRKRKNRKSSPDGRYQIDFKDHDVWLIDTRDDGRIRLTENGSAENTYGNEVWWSPNSKHFVAWQKKPGQGRSISLIDSSPDDSIHAQLLNIPYAKPGDDVELPTVVLFSRDRGWDPVPIENSEFPNPFALTDLSWHPNSRAFSFLYNERGHQRLRLMTVNANSGDATVTIDETSDTFICYSSKKYAHYLQAIDCWIWMSERSGWNHLYLIDATTGEVRNPITTGPWVVRGVERVDEENKWIYARVSGLDPKQDPYHVHFIRVNFDGTNLIRLTAGDGDHQVIFSPDERFLVDRYSRVDLPPMTQLRDGQNGKLICDLETADISSLMSVQWQTPERFVATGRDGKTPIYGIIIRPTRFDPNKRYPVLEAIYAGPHSAFVPKRFGLHHSLARMAELGFIVVKIDGMGTNHRSKDFHDVCWKNLADSGFPDRIAWIKEAGKTRPEMDLSRVGIWGGSAGGQSAMRALIDHGDFYHAAVADCGCHDNRVDKIWWNEQWMGWPIGPHYQSQSNVSGAHKVTGDLMLIWGELDRNVDPASTLQVVDALIKADKDFEQLIVPGVGHGAASHPYAQRRQADFFIRRLWKREPRTPTPAFNQTKTVDE
jgi:dipeptidyl aminopeptidase/acylaminoacyl peptidase